jgi:outer membrane protein
VKSVFPIAALLALAGCASARHAVDSFRPPDSVGSSTAHLGPGTAAAPETPWAAPADAVPRDVPPRQVTLPAGLEAGKPVTLAQVINVALANNPATRTAWLEARAAEAGLGSARAAYLPEIDVLASLTHSHGATRDSGTTTTFAPSLALNYLLFDFGGREAEVEQARQTLIAFDFLHNTAIQDVILQTQQAYYGYLDAKALLAAQDATLKERQVSLDAAEARHRAGVATIADVLQARTALSQARLTYETIEGNLRTIEGSLATAMGLPPTTRFDFGELPLEIPARQIGDAIEALLTRAATSRPDLAAQRALAERAAARVQAVRAQGLPSISLNASAGQVFGTGSRVTPYSAGVALRFPLFTGWRNTYDVRQAELQRAIAEEDVRGLTQQIQLQVWTSYYALQTAEQRLTTSRDLLASAQQSVDVARERYRAGVGSILDLLTAESAVENARAQEVQARADWFVAVAQLAHDTGTLGER